MINRKSSESLDLQNKQHVIFQATDNWKEGAQEARQLHVHTLE